MQYAPPFNKIEKMDRSRLTKLYKDLENFVAEISHDEYQANKEAINGVYTLIHQYMIK